MSQIKKLSRTKLNQVGGTHYAEMQIQPSEFIMQNNFDWFQGNAIKYLCRHKLKGNALDVKKAIHYAQMLLEAHYGIESTIKYTDETEEGPKKRKPKRAKKEPTIVSLTPGTSVQS